MAIKCPGCGANVSDYDKACSYCGSINTDYRSPDKETTIKMGDGMEAFKNGQYASAIRCFLDVIDLTPEVFDAHLYLSACQSALNRPQEALKAMEQAQKLRPGSAPLYYNLAILCKQTGRKEDAKKYLDQALLIAKTDTVLPDPKDFEKLVKKELNQTKRWKFF